MKSAPVNKIIPFSNVDGPGNRTSIFFQGCPFHCLFCHNPETIHLCSGCGTCVNSCPAQALRFSDGTPESAAASVPDPHKHPGTDDSLRSGPDRANRDANSFGTDDPLHFRQDRVVWDPDRCVQCDTCIRVCPHGASPRVQYMTVEEVLSRIRRTAPYINGITVSGGECTLQNDFLIDLFTEVKKMGDLTCLLDSNGSFDFEADHRLLDISDGVMLDVKAVGRSWSEYLISASPDLVLKNLDYLLGVGKLQEVRTVIFPGRDPENEETVRYVAERIQGKCDYRIIRYRPFGVREEYQAILGEVETDPEYAGRYASLARELGADKAYVV